MPNGTYGGVRGRKTKVGRKLLRFPPTRSVCREYVARILLSSFCIFEVNLEYRMRLGIKNQASLFFLLSFFCYI